MTYEELEAIRARSKLLRSTFHDQPPFKTSCECDRETLLDEVDRLHLMAKCFESKSLPELYKKIEYMATGWFAADQEFNRLSAHLKLADEWLEAGFHTADQGWKPVSLVREAYRRAREEK
jgi:hypothetical protein